MTDEAYRAAIFDVAYLAACAVNETVPDAVRVKEMDLELLYKAADRHLLTGITAMALESAGVKDQAFTQALGKAVRKVTVFDLERAVILAKLEEAGIWHMPLKGSVLKSLYPKTGMRQMADNDILCDPFRMSDVRDIMESLGFTTDSSYGHSIHDHYYKPPVCNFEMHRALFSAGYDTRVEEYYQNVKSRLIINEGSRYGYHFSDEDFYIYMLAHEYKHYANKGTGLRSLLDTYVYVLQKGSHLDWSYIGKEAQKLGIAEFERNNRDLAMHLFSGEPLTEQDKKMLDYVLSSGTYGTMNNYIRNQIEKRGRIGYLLSRTFPPLRSMKMLYPVLERMPFLLPLCWVLRLAEAVIRKPRKVIYQLTAAFKYRSR
jgi:hypothetical protein